MRRLVGCCVFFILVSLARASFGQTVYLEPGQSGLAVAGGLAGNDAATSLSLLVGYSFAGKVDVGGMIHHYWVDTGPGFDASGIGVQPYVNVTIVRQSATFPVSIAGTASYQKIFYQTDPDIDFSYWSVLVGGSVYRRVQATPKVSVSPQLTLGLLHAEASVAGLSGDDDDLYLQLAGNIGIQDGAGRLWIINPYLAANGDTTFGIFGGLLFQ